MFSIFVYFCMCSEHKDICKGSHISLVTTRTWGKKAGVARGSLLSHCPQVLRRSRVPKLKS